MLIILQLSLHHHNTLSLLKSLKHTAETFKVSVLCSPLHNSGLLNSLPIFFSIGLNNNIFSKINSADKSDLCNNKLDYSELNFLFTSARTYWISPVTRLLDLPPPPRLLQSCWTVKSLNWSMGKSESRADLQWSMSENIQSHPECLTIGPGLGFNL